jgi:hypothetical protein
MIDHRMPVIFVTCLLGTALAGYDLVSAISTGKARGRWGNTIRRVRRPKAYWTWMAVQGLVVALFIAGMIWAGKALGYLG